MVFDRNNSAQVTALRNELTNDTRGYGLVAAYNAGNDSLAATILNAIRDGSNIPTNPTGAGGQANGIIPVKRTDVSPSELLEAIDIRDFPVSSAQIPNMVLAGSWLESICQVQRGVIRLVNDDGSNSRVRSNLNRLLGDANNSQTRFTALATRSGSRAEELFGINTVLSDSDVSSTRT